MHCWARYLFILVVAVLGTGQMIVACGQKGDLYIPEAAPKQAPSQAETGDVPEIQTGEVLEIEDDIAEAQETNPNDGN